MEKKVGHYSFVVGVILAVILGLVPASVLGVAYAWLASLLVLLGLIVGFLNVAGKETKEFLLVAAVLIIAAGIGTGAGAVLESVTVLGIGGYLSGLFTQILAFIVPATIVVALKDILALTKMD